MIAKTSSRQAERGWLLAAAGLVSIGVATGGAAAQSPERVVRYAYAAKPRTMTAYAAPNRPVWRLANILAAHRGIDRWAQQVLDDPDYTVKYIMMAPGDRTIPQFWADDRVFWVVLSGRMRVTIEGQAPFEAARNFLVNVPYRATYSMEAIGSAPVLRVEITRTGRTPLFPFAEGAAPPAATGEDYVKISYNVLPGTYELPNRPFVDFQKEWVESARAPGSTTWVEDNANSSFIIRGKGVPTPPPSNRGHFHVDYGESWLILEGQCDYLIEGEKFFTAGYGDFVYAPRGRWHRASFAGTGTDTRMSITPRVAGLHAYGADAGARQ